MGKTKKHWDKKRYKEKHATNEHHKINKSRWWTNKFSNVERILVTTHRALHKLFWNETPAKSIETLINFFWECLAPAFRKDLLAVLSQHKGMEHNAECYHWSKVKGWGATNTLLQYNYTKDER